MRLAVIPARGGSKRIPRKNIKLFCGKPIISYSITAALQSGIFDRVIVSTDDPEIAEVSRQYGAETPFVRPAELANDFAGTITVVGHSIKALNVKFSQVCCIYATAPFIEAEDLCRGLDIFSATDVDYAFSVTSFPYPIQRAFRINSNGQVEMFQPENYRKRSQDLEEAFHDAGQFYWGKPIAFVSDFPVFASNSAPVLLSRRQVQDIDTPEDWEYAELMFEAWKAKDR
jgi:N-acylneuraminate cytidylyltransferase